MGIGSGEYMETQTASTAPDATPGLGYDVFVSYSQHDKSFVDALVHSLEAENIRCWYAPRDIPPGMSWPAAITHAISQSRAMILVFSGHSNQSAEVAKELTLASNHKRVVVPVRIEMVLPNEEMQYHLGNRHWLDVYDLEMELALQKVKESLGLYVALKQRAAGTGDLFCAASRSSTASRIQKIQKNLRNRSIPLKVVIAGSFCLILATGLFIFFFFASRQQSVVVTPHPTALRPQPETAILPAEDSRVKEDSPDMLFRKAQTLLAGKKAPQAIILLEKAAAAGSGEACSTLGDCYYSGIGVAKSARKAAEYYAKGAELGNAQACYSLACLYADGTGVARNAEMALKWFTKAAQQGDAAAQFSLGDLYENGRGVTRNPATAYSWYLKAAESGDATAQYKVGVMLHDGMGVQKNREEGLRWLFRASENGEPAAEAYLR